MRIFLDANILVSVLNKEYPVYPYSSRVLSLIDRSRFDLYTSPTCLAIAFYFAEKKNGTTIAKKKIHLLTSEIQITPTDKSIVLNVFKNKSIHDFEDGLQYYAALGSKCKCIITEDQNDFHFSEIEVLGAEKFLIKYVIKKN